ncbi:hypothetical protein D9757_000171 [Collybiopsis confluens]|uniref:DUF803-domain-containing protein n=1 Tax=Collybiopsis confluens TaxID=2823264 RepID=A0A8H5I219_9AGAR|nr:hypothetical protein D9757_000171 [Collybiopsis confluens]
MLQRSLPFAFGSSYEQPYLFPELSTGTIIGISVAIAGNVLISISLNLQKLAHKRMNGERSPGSFSDTVHGSTKTPSLNSEGGQVSTVEEGEEGGDSGAESSGTGTASNIRAPESESLFPFPRGPQTPATLRDYGSTLPPSSSKKRKLASRILPFRSRQKPRLVLLPVDIVPQNRNHFKQSPTNTSSQVGSQLKDQVETGNESDYLKSKLWWSGFLLMNVGEMGKFSSSLSLRHRLLLHEGNFISYAWAPASVVAPLGTFALVANCVFSPLILGEHFRKRDLLGVAIAIIGAVTVVLSSNASDVRLDPDRLVNAISQTPFIVYTCIYAVAAMVLASMSQSSYGPRYALVDVGLCALFGGFTVLSTKAVSTLLTMPWSEVFTKFITYPVILVLALTGVGQIRYLNRALMRFDSKIVIPIQFVLFNLSAIVGSAILFGDFRKASFHQVVTFLYGCAATFVGVFIIAWSSQNNEADLEDPETEQSEEEEELEGAAARRAEQVASHLRLGSLGRRRRATLILPDDIGEIPSLHHKHSAIMGLSPAQPLLLVHTPPREQTMRDYERDLSTPSSYQRPRAMSWFGGDSSPRGRLFEGGRRTRESSLAERLQSNAGASIASHINSPHLSQQ